MDQETREKERALFEAERKRAPELFERKPMIDDDEFLRKIGIEEEENKKPVGYLRFMPQDFIVEEIDQKGKVHTIDIETSYESENNEGLTWYADLVKIGISTLDAKDQIAEALGIEGKQIGFAGIKDRLALTSQRISIRGMEDASQFEPLSFENMFLKNISRGKGAVANGELQGNRFIITLRSPGEIPKAYQEEILEKANYFQQEGFWNFFSFQRFGTPRLLNRMLGMHLVKREYEKVVKIFITFPAERELPYFKQIRNEIAGMWGNWRGIKERIKQFPYHFPIELKFINHLIEDSGDFLGALHTVPDQIRLWMYAYDCYLFNK